MNNWFYSEMELMNKHKMLKEAGKKHYEAKHALEGKKYSLHRRLVILFERSLVSAGKWLLDWYKRTNTDKESSQIIKAK